jgi:hypothetical protein
MKIRIDCVVVVVVGTRGRVKNNNIYARARCTQPNTYGIAMDLKRLFIFYFIRCAMITIFLLFYFYKTLYCHRRNDPRRI